MVADSRNEGNSDEAEKNGGHNTGSEEHHDTHKGHPHEHSATEHNAPAEHHEHPELAGHATHEAQHDTHHTTHTPTAGSNKKTALKASASRLLSHAKDKKYIYPTAIYLLIALLMFAPITINMTSVAPGIGGDTYLNLWDIWWVSYATFTLHTSIWSTNLLFWPVGANLAYQTMAPIASLLSAPFQIISVPFAYNVLFFLGFAVSGLTMFILAEYLTKNRYAAFFAGLAYAFSSIHIALAYSHIDWINIEWIPLAVYFALRLVNEQRKYLNAAGLAICMVLVTFMSDIEQTLMTLFLLLLIFAIHLIQRDTRKLVLNRQVGAAIAMAIVLTFVLGSWGFIPMLSAVVNGGIGNANFLNNAPHNMLWSDDVLSFFLPSYYNGLFNGLASHVYYNIFAVDPSERVSYIGYTVLLLGLYGLSKNFKNTGMWLVVCIVFGWIALGPYVQLNASPSPINGTMSSTGIPGLYSLYHALPVVNVIREPGRFDLIFSLAAAVLAAYGLSALLGNLQKKDKNSLMGNAMFVVAVIAVLFLIENNGTPLTTSLLNQVVSPIYVPNFYYALANVPGNFSVLYLPALANQASPLPSLYPGIGTYYTSIYHKPLVGGDITRQTTTDQLSLFNIPLAVEASNLESYGNPTYQSPVNENYTNETLLTLYNYNTSVVVLDTRAYNASDLLPLEQYMNQIFGKPVYYDNTTVAFSTISAATGSVYRSFVAYPTLSYWASTQALLNGTQTTLWIPSALSPSGNADVGPIVVYAPFKNKTNIQQQLLSKSVQVVNATIHFQALDSGTPTLLSIQQETSKGTFAVAEFNLTSRLQSYSANVQMVSGPIGNNFLFVSQSKSAASQSAAGIVGITFYGRN